MNKIYKIFIIFTLFIFILFSFCNNVLASSSELNNFTGFDGNIYNLDGISDRFNDYNYYLILKTSTRVIVLCFNNKIEIVRRDNITFIFDDETSVHQFRYNGSSWTTSINRTYSTDLSSSIIYSSIDLRQYAELLNTGSFIWDSSQINEEIPLCYTLKPIIEDVGSKINILSSTFKNIFYIFPILFVVLISFIGTRKGISYLFGLLRHS